MPCRMVPYAMRHYDRESRAETRSPAVWCMQLGKCDPYPARCWKQKLVVIVRFCSFSLFLAVACRAGFQGSQGRDCQRYSTL